MCSRPLFSPDFDPKMIFIVCMTKLLLSPDFNSRISIKVICFLVWIFDELCNCLKNLWTKKDVPVIQFSFERSAWGSIESMTILTTHPSLNMYNYLNVHLLHHGK